MINKREAEKILELIDNEIQEVKKVFTDIPMRNVCIRRLQNCKNQVFLNSELYYEKTGIRKAI